MANVTIRYNNEIIGELNNLGSLIMKTAGHACEFDIELDYINHCPRENPIASFRMTDLFANFQPTAIAEEVVE